MNPLKIVFMGSPDFAVPTLDRLNESEHEIVCVVSGTDKRRNRRGKPVPTTVKKRALELELPTLDVDDVKSDRFEEELKKLDADLFVVVAFKILPPNILEIPKKGSINLHASLLPKYRGAAPIHWAVIRGEKETGCTVFFLEKSVDTGSIIGRVKTSIKPNETTGNLYERLKDLGAELVVDSVDKIAADNVDTIEQNDEEATSAPKLFRENTKLDFDKSAQDVHNKIRGLNPFPKAWCNYDGEKMNVYKSEVVTGYRLEPGELTWDDGKLIVGCGSGAVQLKEIQLPGTKKLSGQDFANGYDLSKVLD